MFIIPLEVLLLKIAQITFSFQPKYYRSNEYFISQEMAKLGHDVVVFCPDKEATWQISGKRSRSPVGVEEYDGFKVERINAGPEILNMPMMPKLLPTLLQKNFDVVHSHECFSTCSFQGAILSKAKKCPLVITQHNDLLPLSFPHRFGYLLANFTIGKFSFSEARKIIVLSNDIRHHLLGMGFNSDKIELIPTAVDTKLFSPYCDNLLESKWGISPPVILFVGRLVREKGVEYLIQAFQEVIKEIPDTKLVILGRGPMESELKILQKHLQIKNVFFIKRIDKSLMPNIYVGCNVLVLPSFREPFGNVVIEAMASGRPVIGSYVGGIKETIVHGETGYHIPPGNTKMLVDFLLTILSDDKLNAKLGKEARKRALKIYDSELIAKKIERIYLNAIS